MLLFKQIIPDIKLCQTRLHENQLINLTEPVLWVAHNSADHLVTLSSFVLLFHGDIMRTVYYVYVHLLDHNGILWCGTGPRSRLMCRPRPPEGRDCGSAPVPRDLRIRALLLACDTRQIYLLLWNFKKYFERTSEIIFITGISITVVESALTQIKSETC